MARTKARWRGKVLVAAVADHMGQQQGAIRFFEDHTADYCILAELTDLNIYLGHRGRAYWDITSIGKAAHTCHRHLAVNAIAKMVPLIEEVEALRYVPDLPEWVAELFGRELYTAVGRIYGGLPPGGPSMIPDECTIRVDSRPQPGVEIARSGDSSWVPSSEPGARSAGAVRRRARRSEASPSDRARPSAHGRPRPGVSVGDGKAPSTVPDPGWPTRRVPGTLPDRDLRSRTRAGLHAERVARLADIEIAAKVNTAMAAILLARNERPARVPRGAAGSRSDMRGRQAGRAKPDRHRLRGRSGDRRCGGARDAWRAVVVVGSAPPSCPVTTRLTP